MRRSRCTACLFVVAVCLGTTSGADWRQFRGPDGQGVSPE